MAMEISTFEGASCQCWQVSRWMDLAGDQGQGLRILNSFEDLFEGYLQNSGIIGRESAGMRLE